MCSGRDVEKVQYCIHKGTLLYSGVKGIGIGIGIVVLPKLKDKRLRLFWTSSLYMHV